MATPVEPPADASVTAMHMVARNDVGQLASIVELIDAGGLVVDIAGSHPMSDLALVHRSSEAGQTRGKIILLA
ncbi:zinc-binding dehydrogenase [Streptomyces sp. NPDC052236]|uniref:zinc-binding dehydrogenase n=1 Tax=Streptomyces sp. NPDC052236 TaxID=3365686 RepID=UPI0037D2F328